MGDPHFRRNLIYVAAFHILLVAALLYFARREIRRPTGDIVWMDPASFSQIAAADHPQEHGDRPDPTPSDSRASTHSDSKANGHSDSKANGHSDSKANGHSDSKANGHSDSK